MAVELNHIIIWCTDTLRSADFLADMLGRPAPTSFLQFQVVDLDNGVAIDFMERTGAIAPQHYAFLVGDSDFDALHRRLRDRRLDHWADPARTLPGAINHHFGGRGVYFADPDGHLLEAITRPYARNDKE